MIAAAEHRLLYDNKMFHLEVLVAGFVNRNCIGVLRVINKRLGNTVCAPRADR